ncbi:hypothetical protein [Amycolatopsis nigrescens]|uniref:hypothetical protein n=1 Tax=Amycolatopsis nigrescens TaxID=381445 RepID=UPI0003A543B9|nr:hypothetical protein [Amycolatopsis nigrescens]
MTLTGCAPGVPAALPPPPSTAPPVVPAAMRPTGCIQVPSACGYPDSTNTGWRPTGITLTTDGITLTDEGELILDQPGAMVDGKDIEGCVSVKADNVVIIRSRIRCPSFFPVRVYEGFRGVVLQSVEIDGLNSPTGNAAVGFDGYAIRNSDIHHVQDGPHLGGDVLIENSYVHDLVGCDICHNDTIQSNGARNAVLRHNTFSNQAGGKNAVVRIATEQAPVFDFTVEDNLLAGGNYALQVRSQGHGFPQNVRAVRNRIVPDWRFGPFDVTGGTIFAEGNYSDDTLAPIEVPR